GTLVRAVLPVLPQEGLAAAEYVATHGAVLAGYVSEQPLAGGHGRLPPVDQLIGRIDHRYERDEDRGQQRRQQDRKGAERDSHAPAQCPAAGAGHEPARRAHDPGRTRSAHVVLARQAMTTTAVSSTEWLAASSTSETVHPDDGA